MAFSKELPDKILKDYHGLDDFYGPQGIMKQLTKALAGRTREAELTSHLGYEKHNQADKFLFFTLFSRLNKAYWLAIAYIGYELQEKVVIRCLVSGWHGG